MQNKFSLFVLVIPVWPGEKVELNMLLFHFPQSDTHNGGLLFILIIACV